MAFTQSNDFNFLQESDASVVSALGGNDVYVLDSALLSATKRITISDTQGVNRLQLVGGLTIASSAVAADTLQLTLSNGAVVTVLGASTFSYTTGGSVPLGTGGVTQAFGQFVTGSLGASAVPAGNTVVNGTPNITVNAIGGTTAGGTVTPGTPTPVFSPPEASATQITEGQSVTFAVRTQNVAAGTVIEYVLGGGSAGSADFLGNPPATGSFTVGSDGVGRFTLVSLVDNLPEGQELVTFSYVNPVTKVRSSEVTVFINDPGTALPTVNIQSAAVTSNEGNSGTTPFSFTVTRTGDLTGASSVGYVVQGTGINPASAGDFAGAVLPTGTVSFAANQATATITVNVAGDTIAENSETFSVTLNSATGAVLGSVTTVQGTITNDDTANADDFTANTATTGRVLVGGSTAGRIEIAGDRDWFRVDLVAGTTYAAFLNGSSTTGALADPFLTVIAPNGAVLGSDDDAGPGFNSLFTFTATSTGAHFLEARAFGTAAGDVGSYTVGIAAAPPPPPPPPPAAPGFQIDLNYNGPTRFLAVIEAAIARWEQIITGDLPDVSTANGVIDDLSLTIDIVAIDGAGGILGQAGPGLIRAGRFGLPYTGRAELDVADVDQRLANGTFDDLVLHEIGHILGIGSLWNEFGFNTTFGRYTGARGLVEYRSLSGNANATFVPLEQTGGAGTANSHWQESLFGNELLTGFINNGSNPLSRLTIAALQDLGYQVSYASADPYALPLRLHEAATGIDEPTLLIPFETTLIGVTRSADEIA